MRLLLMVCVAMAGCSRDLTEVTDRQVEPAYLGELSGLYDLSLLLEIPDPVDPLATTTSEIPFGSRLKLLHLRDAEGGSEDFLIGVEEESYLDGSAAPLVGEPAGYRRLFFDATFDGTEIQGASNKGPIRGKRVAGGGMVTIDNLINVCPVGPRYPLVGRLLCPVNPALSGVYGGLATSCDTGEALSEDIRYLAIGFIDNSFLGLSYPGTETLLEGIYNHYAEAGAGFSYGNEWALDETVDGTELWFSLAETEGRLDLAGQFFVFTGCNQFPCPEPACEALSMSRLAGGTATECYANDVAPAIGNATTRRSFGENGGRFLYVETQFMEQLPDELVSRLANGILRRADNAAIAIEGEPPGLCTPDCPCDLDCCECDQNPDACDAGCDCDRACPIGACPCGAQGDGACAGDCRCDLDCLEVCDCNTDNSCTPDCFCDPECFCDCERPPEYALRFPLPPVPPQSTVQYELFLNVPGAISRNLPGAGRRPR